MPDARGNVNMKLTADEADALLKWRRVIREGPEAFARSARRAGKDGKRAGSETTQGMSSVAREAGRAATTLLGVGTAVGALITFTQVLRNEIDQILRRQNLSGTSQVRFGDAFRRAVFALGNDPHYSPAQLRADLLADRSGVDPALLALESEAALSARGQLRPERAQQTVAVAARLRPDLDTESRRSLVSGALALQKGFNVSPNEAVAGVIQSLSAARTEQLDVFSKNMISAIAQSTAFGGDQDSFRELASLFIGVGQRSEDPTGRRTATNTIKFIEQIVSLSKQRGIVGPDANVTNTLRTLLSGAPGSEAEKLRQELVGVFDKQLGEIPREFEELKKAILLGEARQRPALLEILDKSQTSKTWREIKTAQDKIVGLNQEAVRVVNGQLETLRRMPDQQAADNQRIFTAALEKQRIEAQSGVTGISAEQLRETLARSGQFSAEASARVWLSQLAAERRTPEEQIAAQQRLLQGQVNELQREGRGFDLFDAASILTALYGGAFGFASGFMAGGLPGGIVGAAIGGFVGNRAVDRGARAITGYGSPNEREQVQIDALRALIEQLDSQRQRLQLSNNGEVKVNLTLLDQDGLERPNKASIVGNLTDVTRNIEDRLARR